jgi:methylated-DNA-[protein]-cysteine S-methyltransferase
MRNVFYYETEIGPIGIVANGNTIANVFYGKNSIPQNLTESETPLIKKAAGQIREYLDGKRQRFDLPLEVEGTEFQKAVWNALLGIPYGETRSYRQIAEQIGRPKACRGVGMANHRNPIAIIIPCHRVIGANGKLVGYAGGVDIKERLLDLEKNRE